MILYGGGASKEGGSASSDGGGGLAVVLKKGPWTAAEDEILAAYVREHGEGNWNAVQKNTGLARCGKSCRLRWANHLRPNLKKGAFTAEEERLIIQLHAQLGNKWARMAAQLPGRTDNEIKNYWNTRLKRLQRQGLPLYPPDIIPNNNHHHHHHHHHHHPHMPTSPLPSPSSTATAPTPSSSFTFQTIPSPNLLRPLSPTPPCHTPTTPQTPPHSLSSPRQFSTLPLFALPRSPSSSLSHPDINAFTFPRPPPLLQPPSFRSKRFSSHSVIPANVSCSSGFSPVGKSPYSSFLTLPYSSPATPTGSSSYPNANASSSSSSSSIALLVSSSPTSPLHSFSLNPSSPYHSSQSPTHHMLHTHFSPSSLQSTEPVSVYSIKPELPSNQMSHSTSVAGYDVISLTGDEKHHHHQQHHHHHHHQNLDAGLHSNSCELLENVLDEAEALASGGRASKRRQVMSLPDQNDNNANSTDNLASFGLCPPQGLREREDDQSLQMNAMQEDITKLLEWGSDSGGEISNGHSSVVTDDNLVLDVHQFASLFPVDTSSASANDHNKNSTTTSCSWDNLPGIF